MERTNCAQFSLQSLAQSCETQLFFSREISLRSYSSCFVIQVTRKENVKASQDHHSFVTHRDNSSSFLVHHKNEKITVKITSKDYSRSKRCYHPKKSTKRRNLQKKESPQKTDVEALTLKDHAQYVALDCEFVGTGPGGFTSALARVSIVDYNHKILMDTYVKVNEPVTDYRTFVSGITQEHLESDLAMDRDNCIDVVQKILQGKILIGHGLKTDLAVLGIHHPWYYTRDTAKYEPFMKKQNKGSYPNALPRPRKLKDLALTKLNRVIQKDGVPHCSIEDAIAALDLYKKARLKWEKVMQYKIQRTIEICCQCVQK